MIASDATTCPRCGANFNRTGLGMMTVLLTVLAVVALFILFKTLRRRTAGYGPVLDRVRIAMPGLSWPSSRSRR